MQSPSCLDFSLIRVLHSAPMNYNSSEPALLVTPMSMHKNILAVSIAHESKVYLWDAATAENDEQQLTSFVVPPEVNRIYDLRVNHTTVVCLAGWGLVAFNYKRRTEPVIVFDFHERPRTFGPSNVFFETHCMEMNEEYVLTHASQPLFNYRKEEPKTYSYLNCRRLLDDGFGQPLRLNRCEIEEMEINKIRLSSSKHNLLAIMHGQEFMSNFSYGIKIMKIPSGEIIQTVLEGIPIFGSEVRCPIQWVDNRLFIKYSPKIHDFECLNPNPEDVILHIWNSEKDKEFVVEHVGMSSLQEDVMIDHARVVQIHHRLYKPPNSNDVSHQVWAKIYNFWNN